jgi:hypothetical protein
MREREFEQWLIQSYRTKDGVPMAATTRHSRVFNCQTLEAHEGDLDGHFARDRFRALLERLSYSKDDERAGAPAKHRIPINGNVYNGMATLRSALNLYIQFCEAPALGEGSHPLLVPAERRPAKPRQPTSLWPDWSVPTESEIIQLARLTVPHVRFLHSEIVHAVVEDNERRRADWAAGLSQRGVDPQAYLWERGACAFPGVRRHSGSKEIAQFRKQLGNLASGYSQALTADDNDYPKHLWSFVFRARPFQKFGPTGYALAHLIDHKANPGRFRDELDNLGTALDRPSLPGLYTSAANCVFSPITLIKPTDFAGALRNLLQRRAASLYGSFCNLTPPFLRIRDAASDAWSLEAFDWRAPVGSLDHIDAFLAFRKETIDILLAAKQTPRGESG